MKFSRFPLVVGLSLPVLFVSPSVIAEEAATYLGEVVVTADRTARSVDDTLASVSIITRDDIEKYQASNLMDVFRRLPSVSVVNSGGAGKISSVRIRGSEADHVLVLIDGIKVGSATSGETAFEHLPLEQIERIEVVRGSRSSLYGSEAIGGVIQIFTRKGEAGFHPSVKIGVGSHNRTEGAVNFSGGNTTTRFNANLAYQDTDGFDSCYSTSAGCFNNEPDDDGYTRTSLSIGASHKFSERVSAELSFLKADNEAEFDGDFSNSSEGMQQNLSTSISVDASDDLHVNFKLGESRDEIDSFTNGVFSSRFNTKRNSASVVADYSLADDHSVLLGMDWLDDKITSSTAFSATQRDNKAIFASYLGELGRHNVDVSLRRDDNEQFDGFTTGSVSVGRALANDLELSASYATAFKAPTFNDLYFPLAFGYSGNANLVPEESTAFEIGLARKQGNSVWELNAFSMDIDNLIVITPDFSTVNNLAESSIRGLEGVYSTRLGSWDLASNFSLQKPENKSGINAGKDLIYRPTKIMNVELDRDFGRWSLGSSIHAESERFTDAANTDSLGGFATVGVRAGYKVSQDWKIGVKVNNVLDKDYVTNKGYNQDGINGLLTIQYAPQ